MEDDEEKKGMIKAILDSTVEKIKTGSNAFLLTLMIGMALVLGANIILRFFFNYPLFWSNTISRYAYIHIVLLGTAISYMEGQHAQINFVYDALPRGFKIVFDVLHILVMMSLSIVLVIIGIKKSVSMWNVHAPVIPWLSVGIVYLAVPICAAVMAVFLIQKLSEIKTGTEVRR